MMKFRHSASIVAGGAMVAVVLAAPPAAGQSARTAWGDPDLQGLWNMTHGTPLERPEGVTAAVLSEEERATRRADRSSAFFTPRDGDPGFYNEFWFEWGKEDNRTAMIDDPPDGRIPMNPGVREREDATRAARREKAESPDTWLDMSVYDRCITRWALPALPTNYNNNWNILQTPGYVVIFQEMIHDARIIPLDGRPHIGAGIRQWLGDSRGRWEGDTLVVETTNFNGKHNFNGSREGLRLVERITRVDADNLDWQWTLEDPSVWSRPWTGSLPLTSTAGPLFEYACHEGNYGLYNILAGARAEEARAQAK
jgi:hypothetical protein